MTTNQNPFTDNRHQKLEALLEIMDCYLDDLDGYENDVAVHKAIKIVADGYVNYYRYKPDLVDRLIRRALIVLDAYIVDPSVEPTHIRTLYKHLDNKGA